jgi:hypothetical protein
MKVISKVVTWGVTLGLHEECYKSAGKKTGIPASNLICHHYQNELVDNLTRCYKILKYFIFT